MKWHHSVPYDKRRRPKYPPLADQLDAIWKGGDDADAMRLRIMAIKSQHPKK